MTGQAETSRSSTPAGCSVSGIAPGKKSLRFVDPIKELGEGLLGVEKPARYTGGEFGRLAGKNSGFQTLIAFPDLYEIGMSNQAMRIIYNALNKMPGISCDRAFAPAPDFERLLREAHIPLYGLDTGISLKDTDILLFTLGYELGATGILTMMDLSDIPIHSAERGGADPIVIAGGPAVSNPLPYSGFIDAFWIGEAEAGFFELAAELAELKKRGQGRGALLECLAGHPSIWVKGKKAVRAIDFSFGRGGEGQRAIPGQSPSNAEDAAIFEGAAQVSTGGAAVFPLPSMKIVQHHGALEIMRGCPNGCRFCHAGFWYRPMRQKSREKILEEAGAFINLGGYREISLSSLSSGDYSGIAGLVQSLNSRFGNRHVSFQMPSLKVSSFSLSILEQISQTRKSGLTFAVETPVDAWQMSINKEVSRNSVVDILNAAKKHGWRSAKFYFMIGLPLNGSEDYAASLNDNDLPSAAFAAFPPIKIPDYCAREKSEILPADGPGQRPELCPQAVIESEETEIVNFITDVARETRMHFNINIGIFVPKPHTPYQWAAQIDSNTAFDKMSFIKNRLKSQGHKVGVSDPLISRIEGLIGRGDERAGDLIEQAFHRGSRLDAWSEYINKETWREILEKNREIVDDILSEKNTSLPLPWEGVNSGVSIKYLRNELKKSRSHETTLPCIKKCTKLCGICGQDKGIVENSIQLEVNDLLDNFPIKSIPDTEKIKITTEFRSDPAIWRILFSFSKQNTAVFQSHLGLLEIFSMAINRAELPVMYTKGFNPLIKLEIASPLSIGISAAAEIAALDFKDKISPDFFVESLNKNLVEGMSVGRAKIFYIPGGHKKHSLALLLWGFCYQEENGVEFVSTAEEKHFRDKKEASPFFLKRKSVLAKNIMDKTGNEWADYFDVYGYLYPSA